MELYYESSEGVIINFFDKNIAAQEPETLLSNGWQYSTISGVNGIGKVKRFYKDAEEKMLNLSIMTETETEFNDLMYRMHQTFDRDIRRLKPGKIWWNGFYKEAFIVDNSYTEFDEDFAAIEKKVTVLSVRPYWIQERTFLYYSMSQIDNAALDYPLDYDLLDYVPDIRRKKVYNVGVDSANFKLRFYGPCTDPEITIGGHRYALVDVVLQEREYAEVDSLAKTIYAYSENGAATNIFHARDRESYIFRKIPYGNNEVTRKDDVGVEITLFDERGEPEWI